MKNLLVISGHPDLGQSIGNRTILSELENAFANAEFRFLDALNKSHQFDVSSEQEALKKADVVVLQFPVQWYAFPALLKDWLDQVFAYGFAYGEGAVLGGKKLILSFTTGAPEVTYSPEGFNKHNIADYFAFMESTANLCGLELQKHVCSYGISPADRGSAEKINAQHQIAKEHANRLIEQIKPLL